MVLGVVFRGKDNGRAHMKVMVAEDTLTEFNMCQALC